ncbi:MAG: hypothetical protein OEV78_07410 [Spirochaetia bacterium]|nr:hypothetical protein [Spirochaetia bacterium]
MKKIYFLAVITVLIYNFGGCAPSTTPGTISGSTSGGGSTTYTIGGSVSGLSTGNSVTLQNNLADDLIVSSNGSFTFSTRVAANSAYSVSVKTPQPAGQVCSVSSGTGTAASNVSTVYILCTLTGGTGITPVTLASPAAGTTTTVNGSLTGTADDYYVIPASISNNYYITLTGSVNYDLYLYTNSTYQVIAYFSTQPAGTMDSFTVLNTFWKYTNLYIKIKNTAGASGSYTLSVNNIGSATSVIGSKFSPDTLTVPTTSNPSTITGTTTGISDYYYSIPSITGHNYGVALTSLSNNVDLYVYDSNTYATAPLCNSVNTGTINEACTASATGTVLYIKVANIAQVSTTYMLSITDTTTGAVANPQPVASPVIGAVTTVSGTTLGTGATYFSVPATVQQVYTVSISGLSADLDLYVFANNNLNTALCQSVTTGTVTETCNATATTSGFVIEVVNAALVSNATFTLTVTNITGTLAFPQSLSQAIVGTPVTLSGTTTGTGHFYYAIPAIRGATYKIDLTGLSANLDLYAYDNDSTFTFINASSVTAGTVNESIASLLMQNLPVSGSGFLYVKVNNTGLTANATYTLTVTNISPLGSIGNPAAFTAPAAGATSSVTASLAAATSYFYAMPATAGKFYSVKLSNMTANFNLEVSDTLPMILIRSGNSFTDTHNELVTLRPAAAYIYVKVLSFAVAGSYTLSITEYGTTSTDPANPTALGAVNAGATASFVNYMTGTGGTTGVDTTTGNDAFLTVTAQANNPYMVRLFNTTDDAGLYLKDGATVKCAADRWGTIGFLPVSPHDEVCMIYPSANSFTIVVDSKGMGERGFSLEISAGSGLTAAGTYAFAGATIPTSFVTAGSVWSVDTTKTGSTSGPNSLKSGVIADFSSTCMGFASAAPAVTGNVTYMETLDAGSAAAGKNLLNTLGFNSSGTGGFIGSLNVTTAWVAGTPVSLAAGSGVNLTFFCYEKGWNTVALGQDAMWLDDLVVP